MTSERTDNLIQHLRQYLLAECFVSIEPIPLKPPPGLNLGALHEFTFWDAELFGLHFVFIVPQRRVEEAPARFLKLWEQVTIPIERSGRVAVFLTDKFSLPARRILAAHHVPFIVPGSHLYLPHVPAQFRDDLLDRIPPVRRARLAPSTQYFLTTLLQCPGFPPNQSEYGPIFGVSRMTISRTVTELEERAWIRLAQAGRTHRIELTGAAREVWHEAKKYLSNPVLRTFLLDEEAPVFHQIGVPAGFTALARHTMISDDDYPTVAITREQEELHGGLLRGRAAITGECRMEVQVWQYPLTLPMALTRGRSSEDLLSLILSVPSPHDERTEQAIEELENKVTWSRE